jgi:NAD(P)-dependent dehydrogenase (short-subunit alcohol dehydrogenase family)
MSKPIALIVGFGPGISYHFAEQLVRRGYQVAVASRTREKVEKLASEVGATAFTADASSVESIQSLFKDVDKALGEPEVVLFNPSARVRGDFTTLDPHEAAAAIEVCAVGGFVTAQEAAKRMIPKKKGAIFFTGATASIKGFPKSAVFAMGKFAVRGLAQSLAKELGPEGIHVAHFVIDGGVKAEGGPDDFTAQNIAHTYMAALQQPPGAWTWEFELRSKNENF